MSTQGVRTLPTSPLPQSSPPAPPPRCPSALPPHPKPLHTPVHLTSSRRDALLLLSLPALIPPPSAAAFGIPGPKEWLKDQKKKASRFVLAPIEASRQRLHSAYLLLEDLGSPGVDSGELKGLLNSAARDCVPQTRSSIVAFQAKTGVEVCTFRLIVKNAASLLDKGDPIKLETEAMLDEVISAKEKKKVYSVHKAPTCVGYWEGQMYAAPGITGVKKSFSFLGDVIDNSDFQLATDRQKAKDGLMDTISSLNKFEQGIKNCLGV